MQRRNMLPQQELYEYLSSLRTQRYLFEVMEQLIDQSETATENEDSEMTTVSED